MDDIKKPQQFYRSLPSDPPDLTPQRTSVRDSHFSSLGISIKLPGQDNQTGYFTVLALERLDSCRHHYRGVCDHSQTDRMRFILPEYFDWCLQYCVGAIRLHCVVMVQEYLWLCDETVSMAQSALCQPDIITDIVHYSHI